MTFHGFGFTDTSIGFAEGPSLPGGGRGGGGFVQPQFDPFPGDFCSGLTGNARTACELGSEVVGGVCPEGTACSGPSVDIGGVGFCIGSCRTIVPGRVDPVEIIPPTPQIPDPFDGATPSRAGGCVPCGPNECRVQVGVDRCGQPRFRKGRMVVNPSTGKGVCVPKKPRMNPMNAKANRRSMSRLKGAHREAKKIIDTLDKFAKPRRSTAARSRKASASCACK